MVDINKLKALIVERGMTQKDVARELGVSDNTFYLWLKNPSRIGLDDAKNIAKILKIDDIFRFHEIFFSDWEV